MQADPAAKAGDVAQIMQRVESNKSKAAKILGISRQTLRKKLMEE